MLFTPRSCIISPQNLLTRYHTLFYTTKPSHWPQVCLPTLFAQARHCTQRQSNPSRLESLRWLANVPVIKQKAFLIFIVSVKIVRNLTFKSKIQGCCCKQSRPTKVMHLFVTQLNNLLKVCIFKQLHGAVGMYQTSKNISAYTKSKFQINPFPAFASNICMILTFPCRLRLGIHIDLLLWDCLTIILFSVSSLVSDAQTTS